MTKIRETCRSRNRGFTLIELGVTLVIVALLATIGMPSLRSYLVTQSIKTASFDTVAALMYARSEAVKRAANVSLTPPGGNWQNGWIITDSTGTMLRQQGPLNGVVVDCWLTGIAQACPPNLTYSGNGRLMQPPGVPTGTPVPALRIVSANVLDSSPVNTRCISVDLSGMPTSRRTQRNDSLC
jgi:type IV fimbrial biogenesis protein FimT